MYKRSLTKIGAGLVLIVLAHASVTGYLDLDGQGYVNDGLERSLVAFGIARGINAIISVVQGSEIALQPAGLGVTLTVGEILDPVNDLVERFSWVMLVTSVSFAMQKFLLDLSAWWVFAFGSAAGFLICAGAIVSGVPRLRRVRPLIVKLALLLVIVRFAVPVAAVVNEFIYDQLLANRYDTASSSIRDVHEELKSLEGRRAGAVTGPSFDASDGWTDKVGRFLDSVAATVDVRASWEKEKEAYTRSVSELTTHVVDMIAVFAIHTVALPLLFLVLAWQSLKLVLHSRFN